MDDVASGRNHRRWNGTLSNATPWFCSDGHAGKNPSTELVFAQGMFNNQRVVAPSANFHWKAAWGGAEVFVTGDFAGWAVRM